MGPLLAKLWAFVVSAATVRNIAVTGGAASVADIINIDVLRREAVKIAPTSDPEALEEAARQIMRMLGLDGSDIRGPAGIQNWRYFHMNMRTGQAWFTRRYNSERAKRALVRSVLRAPSGVVAGGFRPNSSFGRGRFGGR